MNVGKETYYPTIYTSKKGAAIGMPFAPTVAPKIDDVAGALVLIMDTATGVFVFTGTSSQLLRSRLANTATGVFTFTGTASQLLKRLLLNTTSGTFVFTGTASALLRKLRLLNTATGSFLFAGNDIALFRFVPPKIMDTETGVFKFAGNFKFYRYRYGDRRLPRP